MASKKKKPAKNPRGQAKVLDIHGFKRLDAAAQQTKHCKRNRAIIYLLFAMALRISEVRQLKLRHVTECDGKIREIIFLENIMTKGNKERETFLTNKKARKVLKEYIEYLQQIYKERNMPLLRESTLFPSQKGGQFVNNHMVRMVSDICRAAGLERTTSHSGRRTWITNQINKGHDFKAIADIVGHENIQTTMGYHEKDPNRLKKIAETSIF